MTERDSRKRCVAALRDLQDGLDEEVANGGLSEGVYNEMSKRLRKAFEDSRTEEEISSDEEEDGDSDNYEPVNFRPFITRARRTGTTGALRVIWFYNRTPTGSQAELDHKELYLGNAGEEYLHEWRNADYSKYFEGEKGSEHIVRIRRNSSGDVEHYLGRKGQERLRKIVHSNGVVHKFDGAAGQEVCTRIIQADKAEVVMDGGKPVLYIFPDGIVGHYDAAGKQLTHCVHPNGIKTYFATIDGVAQSKYMTVDTDGESTYFTGTCGKEKQAMFIDKHGKMHVRAGPRKNPKTVAIFKNGKSLPIPPAPQRMGLRSRD